MGACKMRFNWRNFLIGFSLVYALLKTLLFLYFLCKSIHDLVEDDEDEISECIHKYFEIVFLSFLIFALTLLFYGTIKVNFQLN
jgi:Na+-driven multidrug efflux pump